MSGDKYSLAAFKASSKKEFDLMHFQPLSDGKKYSLIGFKLPVSDKFTLASLRSRASQLTSGELSR